MSDTTEGPVDDPTNENAEIPDDAGASDDASAADDVAVGPAADTPAPRRPSPGAQAASRARRIGGRPTPGPRPGGDDGATSAAPTAAPPTGKPVTPSKPAKPTKPARAPRPVADAATTARRQLVATRVLALVGVVAIVALLGVGLWLSHGVWWNKSSTDTKRTTTRQQVLASAKTCTAAILSYDYRTLDAAEKAGQACATGQLKSDYTELMDKTVKTIAPQNNVVQVFQVEKAGIQSVSPDGKQWVVVVYGQQQVTSKTVTSGPRLDISNAIVTLNKVGGQWLISNMTTPS